MLSFSLACTLALGLNPASALQAYGDETAPPADGEEAVEVVTDDVATEETQDPAELQSEAIDREDATPSDGPASEDIDRAEPGTEDDLVREDANPTDEPASKNDPFAATDYTEIYDLLYSAHESEIQAYEFAGDDLGTNMIEEEAGFSTAEAKSADRVAGAAPTASVYDTAAAGDYSDTNVQVEGIDEADIIKTDGQYIYRLSTDGDIYILKADGAKSEAVSHFTLSKNRYAKTGLNYSSSPFALYISDGKLIVLRSLSYWTNVDVDDSGVMPLDGIEPRMEAEEDAIAETTDETVDETTAQAEGEVADEAAEEVTTIASEPAATSEATETGEAATVGKTAASDEGEDATTDDGKKLSVGQTLATEDTFDPSRFITQQPKTALSESLTLIDVFDITDPTKPTQVYQLAQSGNNNTSRLADGTLTLITNTYLWNFIDANKDEAGTFIPSTFDNAGASKVVSPDHVYVFPSENTYDFDNYTTVARYDIATGELVDSYALMGSFSETYMSPTTLYVARNQWQENNSDPYQDSVYTVVDTENYTKTTITRMAITDDALELGASATLDGYLRNQFNMDEYNGYLRVALCDDRSYSRELKDDSHDVDVYQFIESKTTNGLYVLDDAMQVVGSIEDIAPDEEIKSVRFDGAVGYVCTFEEIDPLFAINLASPTNPEILSALKIPGFSSYLHPFGEGRLLGFGQSVENNMTSGLKLSMYDTTDPADVKEIATYDIDGTYSEALYDHHAIFVSVEKGIIGVPVDDAYQLFSYTEGEGFAPYPLADEGEALTSESLGFYGDPRGLFSGDDLYVCSDWVLVVYDLTSGELLTTDEFKKVPRQEFGPYYAR